MLSLGFPALAWLSGAYMSELRAGAARSRREQELETGRAVAEEQARVGRELHDVIAHTLSVIVIQAGAADDVFDTSPDKARQALGSIGSAGRQALAELRRVLATVRPQAGEEEGWAPQPGLSRLGELLAQVRATGLTVTARVDGAPADLPAGLDLSAYRIVQEALTNTLKHARADTAEVTVRYSPAGLLLEVLDDGQPAAPAGQRGPAPGRGLIGIRERAAIHGGTCAAGPRPGGGFGVRVSFPLDAFGRAGTVASGTATMSPREPVAMKETAMSLPAQPDPRSRPRRRRPWLSSSWAMPRWHWPWRPCPSPWRRPRPGRSGPGVLVIALAAAADAAAGVPPVAPGLGAGRRGRRHRSAAAIVSGDSTGLLAPLSRPAGGPVLGRRPLPAATGRHGRASPPVAVLAGAVLAWPLA